MNFSAQEFMFGRQRVRQWVPLITQQSRLRHVYQLMGLNIGTDAASYYFTLHLTTMCAPFYTSESVSNPNPKWAELNLMNMPNLSASCIVLRIWQQTDNGADKIILTWGVNFSGLCYIGNKISDIQPFFFKKNSVIFCMQGGFYTSHEVIRTDLQKPVPFLNNLNLIDTAKNKVIYKRIAVKSNHHLEVQPSYNIEKLKRLHHLQVQIRKTEADVQNIRDKINVLNGFNVSRDKDVGNCSTSSSFSNIRYAPQLLTMNCLNRMLQEKPTHTQKQEMVKINKEIEVTKFKTKLLSQEKVKKSVIIRSLKQKHAAMVENNEERNSDLMENYHKLSRGLEKLKEYKKNLIHHREMYTNIYSQLQQRRRQLLKELIFIFPIEKTSQDKYTIIGIHLPNSDVLADCNDSGFSVALGYIAHILIMCSTFLQVPIRYPLTHYGSRSFITDNVSPLFPDKERDFPLYTRGKEKAQFTYAVYLLNKNLAQFRWLIYMNTTDLKATLYNLLTFLQGPKDLRIDHHTLPKIEVPLHKKLEIDKLVSLRSFNTICNVSDPLLDCIRHENRLERSSSPGRENRVDRHNGGGKKCVHSECGRGLSEILAVPEAYMSRQISSDSFRNFMFTGRGRGAPDVDACCGSSTASESNSITNSIKITNGKEIDKASASKKQILVEQGTDPLATTSDTLPVEINDVNLREKKENSSKYGTNRLSRSVGSYSDDEQGLVLRTNFELGSEPSLNISCDDQNSQNAPIVEPKETQQEFLEKWLESTPNFAFGSEEILAKSSNNFVSEKSPLMARTNALRTTTTFNLVKPK